MDKQIIGLQQAVKVLVTDWVALHREGSIEAERFSIEQLIELIFSIIDLDNSIQGSSFRGTAIPSTNPGAQTQPGFWLAITEGTYANMGGVVVPANSFAIISYSPQSGTYSVVTATLPQPTNKILAWSAATVYNTGDQTTRSGQIWQTSATTVAGEEPGVSPKWFQVVDLTKYVKKSLTVNIGTSADSTYATAATVTSTRAIHVPVGIDGAVKRITCRCARVGDIKFKVLVKGVGDTFTLKSEFTVNLPALGLNIIDIPTGVNVLATDYIGWYTAAATGYIAYKNVGAGAALYYNSSIDLVGSDVAMTTTNTVDFGLNIEISSLDGELDVFEKSITDKTSYIKNDGKDLSTYTLSSAFQATRIMLDPILIDGFIGDLKTRVTRAGAIKFKVFSKNVDGTLNLLREQEVTGVLGENTFKLNLEVSKGNYFGWAHLSGGFVGYKTASNVLWYVADGDAVGVNIVKTLSTTVDFGLTFNVIAKPLSSLVTALSPPVFVPTARTSLQTIGTIVKNSFYSDSALPADWVNTGAFIPTTSGLQSPLAGSWGTVAYWNKLLVLDEDVVTAKFVIKDLTSIFSLVRTSAEGLGTAFEIDCAAGNINLYSVLTGIGATPSSVASTKPIGFAIVLNREYYVTIRKVSELYYFTFTDSVTQVSSLISWNSVGNATSIGKCWNYPGVVFRQGSILMLELCLSSALPRSPKVFIVGDSITDGDTIRTSIGGGYMNRWAGLLSTALSYNTSIMARGGETTTQVNAKLPLINQMLKSPQFAIYAMGTNDTVFSTWETNMLAFKAAIEAKGAELILTTLFPRSGREAFCLQVTNYILTSGIRYIDFAKALTIDGDRVTRDNSLLLPDQLHPLPIGHKKMFDQAKVNISDILNF